MDWFALDKTEINNSGNEYYFSLGAETENMTTRNGFAVMRRNEVGLSIDKRKIYFYKNAYFFLVIDLAKTCSRRFR